MHPSLTGRPGRLAAQAGLIAAVVGGSLTYAHADTDVVLDLDGKTRKVSSFSDTVAEVLADQHVDLSSRDLVAPAPGTSLDDGDRIVVRHARPVTVTVDGVRRTYWSTALTVDGAMRALGIRQDAQLSASRSQPIGRQGLALSVSTPKRVTVVADGKRRSLTTTDVTVEQLLRRLDLELSKLDRMDAEPAQFLVDGMTVRITRVVHKEVTDTQSIAYSSTTKRTSTLYEGQSRTVTEGRSGKREVTYRVTLTDGKETGRKRLSEKVIRKARTRVVEVGTKDRPSSSRSSHSSGSSSHSSGGGHVSSSAGGLNWAALAACESGGNPRAVSPNGLYHGLYQFSVSTWRAVGGSGLPSQASAAEQTHRAQILYSRAGAGQWPVCGKRL